MEGATITSLYLAGWGGCVFGLSGAVLLTTNSRWSPLGWVFFLASNLCWIGYAAWANTAHIELQHLGYMATSLLGIYRWLWARPRVSPRDFPGEAN